MSLYNWRLLTCLGLFLLDFWGILIECFLTENGRSADCPKLVSLIVLLNLNFKSSVEIEFTFNVEFRKLLYFALSKLAYPWTDETQVLFLLSNLLNRDLVGSAFFLRRKAFASESPVDFSSVILSQTYLERKGPRDARWAYYLFFRSLLDSLFDSKELSFV